jgi:hypothetical protein
MTARNAARKAVPRGIRAWQSRLTELSPEIVAMLAPWLPRIAALVGPLHQAVEAGTVEPDGYRGLDRHEAWQRLPASSWLLLDEAPDEFMRRAAMSEHLFFALDRREPAQQRRCVVLFDAGPDSLGSPRLAHLALLCVLHARAQAAGADFAWGVLQDLGTGGSDWSRRSARTLLDARTHEAASIDDVDLWLQSSSAISPGDEVLLILGRAIEGLPSRVRVVMVDEPVLAEPPALRAQVGRREALLPLPTTTLRGRILKDPFAQPKRPKSQGTRPQRMQTAELSLRPGIRLSLSGNRLLGVDRGGTIVALQIPRAGKNRYRKHRSLKLPPDETLVAIGWGQQSLLAVSVVKDEWRMYRRDEYAIRSGPLEQGRYPASRQDGVPGVVAIFGPPTPDSGDVGPGFVQDAEGMLLKLDGDYNSGHPRRWQSGTLLFDVPNGSLLVAGRIDSEEAGVFLRLRRSAATVDIDMVRLPDGVCAAWSGWGQPGRFGRALGFLFDDGIVRVWDPRDPNSHELGLPLRRVKVSPHVTICGVTSNPGRAAEPLVLTVNRARSVLHLVGPDGTRIPLPPPTGRIEEACTSPGRPLIAWRLETGVVEVYSLETRSVVLRVGGAKG